MSENNVLRHFMSRVAADSAREAPETDGDDDYGTFGWLRGARERAITLELRKKDGSVVALGYAWLERATFDPSEGITLTFSGPTVTIVGRNLNNEVRPNVRMFDGLVRHRVPWIQEADERTAMQTTKDVTVIERIEVK